MDSHFHYHRRIGEVEVMRDMLRSRSVWWVGGALLLGLGFAVSKALKVDIDYDPWSDDALSY